MASDRGRRARDRGAGARERRLAARGHGHQRMQAERVRVAGEDVEARRPAAVAHRDARRDGRGGGGDLRVGHAQQHGVHVARVRPTAERAVDGEAGGAQGGGEGGAEAALSDDRAGGECLGPVQFSHGRYRLVASECRPRKLLVRRSGAPGAEVRWPRGLGGVPARRAQGGLAAGADVREVPSARLHAHQGRVRRRQRGRRPHVRRRGAGRERGQARPAVRRPGREAARHAARRDRPGARRRVRRERP